MLDLFVTTCHDMLSFPSPWEVKFRTTAMIFPDTGFHLNVFQHETAIRGTRRPATSADREEAPAPVRKFVGSSREWPPPGLSGCPVFPILEDDTEPV